MKAKKFFCALRGLISATHLYALPPAAFNIMVPTPFINPVSAPALLDRDYFAASVKRGELIVGHIPRGLSKTLSV